MPEKNESTETLDGLIDRIQKEGIEKAEAESAERVAAAEKEAAEMVDAAKKKAEAILARAEDEGKQFETRSRQALTQAARDTILSVSQTLDTWFEQLAVKAVKQSLAPETLRHVILDIIKRYFSDPEAQQNIDVLVSKDDAQAIGKQLTAAFGEAAKQGITLGEDNDLTGGFKLSMKDDHLYHDLSVEAISRLLTQFLRPQLAEITRDALNQLQSQTPDAKR